MISSAPQIESFDTPSRDPSEMATQWDDLPQEVQMRVLANLPPSLWLCYRAVSKAWKEMIDQRHFASLCAEMWVERPWFIMFQRVKVESAFMYDPRAKEWYKLPLRFLPVRVCGRAAAGSLLCVEQREKGAFKALYVCDPLAKTWIKLPPLVEESPDDKRSVILMMVDELISAYKVYVNCNDQMQVYDSLSTSWKSLGHTPLVWFPSMSSVLCRNCLFTLSPGPGNGDIVPADYQLLKFNPDEGMWRPVNVEMPPCLSDAHLAEQGGRIMMVGGVWGVRRRMVKKLRIWELNQSNPGSLSWDLISQVPDYLWEQLRCGDWNTSCALNGEWICIVSKDRLLSFNLETKKWVLSPPSLPRLPRTETNWSIKNGLLNLVNSFKPNFSMDKPWFA